MMEGLKIPKMNLYKLRIYVILWILAASFVLLRSYSTSFLFPDIYGNDSAQFQIIGRMWGKGKLPYTDCFDHKGPIIFFINMIGYMITGNSNGILFLQAVFMFFTLLAIYSICRNDRYWLMIVLASLFTIAFIAGMMLLLCPFIIYFGIKGQLYELYFGTIGFNLLYQKKMTAWIRDTDVHTWLHFMVVYAAYFSGFLSVILALLIHKYRLMGYCIMLAVMETWLFMGGAGYSQYGIIAIPNITLFWVLLLDVGHRYAKWFQRLTVVLLCA